MTTDEPKPGPKPDRLELEGSWEERLRSALQKKKPSGGWPKPEGRKAKRSKAKKR